MALAYQKEEITANLAAQLFLIRKTKVASTNFQVETCDSSLSHHMNGNAPDRFNKPVPSAAAKQ